MPANRGLREKVHNLFLKHRRLTDIQIQRLLPEVNTNSIRPSRLKLERMGLIRRTNDKLNKYTIFEIVNKDRKKAIKSNSQLAQIKNSLVEMQNLIRQMIEVL